VKIVNGNLDIQIAEIGSLFPSPPPGSEFDQSTLDYSTDIALVVSGASNGDPTKKNYLNQGFKNEREGMTSFGVVVGYIGNVTNVLTIGIATDSQRKASPQDSNGWLAAANLDPSKLTPGNYYYITLTVLGDPFVLPDEMIYLMCATAEPWVDMPQNGWVWAALTSAPYWGPFDVYDSTTWQEYPYDTLFWTTTLSESAIVCSDYKTVAECIAEECYWYDGSCHDAPQLNCAEHTTQSECITAGCYWYSNSCHDNPLGDCESYTNQTNCAQAGCYWYNNICNITPQNGGIVCGNYTTKTNCEANDCWWYNDFPWASESCHALQQNMVLYYLPYIAIGGAVVAGIAAFALTRKKSGVSKPMIFMPMQ